MPEPREYEVSAALLREIATVLYGSPNSQRSVTIEGLYERLGTEDTLAVDFALKRMEIHQLLSLDLRGSRVGKMGYGKIRFEQDCIPEMVLGRDYISKKYRDAIVHLIVEDANHEESGGTGFFCAHPINAIVTAAHVLVDRTLKRIESNSGAEVPLTSSRIRSAPDGLDLAVIECELPGGVQPIRVEWNPVALSTGSELIVFGYPKVAFHLPGLYQSKAELHSILKRYQTLRDSLIVSSSTHPGCSGGPVLDSRGFAIGVIEQENALQLGTTGNAFFGATPTHYLSEIAP